MAREESFHDGLESDVVFRARKAMSFVRKDDVNDRDALLGHRRDDLVALGHFAAYVVRAMADKHRLCDLAGPMQRRARLEKRNALFRSRIANAPALNFVDRRPI